MTKRDLAFVGCKLLGLYYFPQALITGLYNIIAGIGMLAAKFPAHHLNGPSIRHSYFSGFFIQVIVACFFWFGADSIARSITPDEPAET